MMSCKSSESVWIVLFRAKKPSKLVDGYKCLREIHCLKSSSTLTMEVPPSSETLVTVYQINIKTTILINMETSSLIWANVQQKFPLSRYHVTNGAILPYLDTTL